MTTFELDPGHGGFDGGANGNGLNEKDLNLKVALYLRPMLEKLGFKVLMTRDSDTSFGTDVSSDSVKRAAIVKNSGADICLSIHFNASNGSGNGAEAIHSIFASQNIINLANSIVDNLASLGIQKRKVYSKESTKNPGTDYYFMHRLTGNVSTIIIESCFIDSPIDAKFIDNDDKLWTLAKTISNGIAKHFGLTQEVKTMTVEEAKQVLKDKFGLEDETIQFLSMYKFGDELILKLAK